MTLLVAVLIFTVNGFFGYWRANTRRLSLQWFLAIHVPVLLAISLRLWLLHGFNWAALTLFVAVFFGGQFAGSRLWRWLSEHKRDRLTSCLVMDLVRGKLATH